MAERRPLQVCAESQNDTHTCRDGATVAVLAPRARSVAFLLITTSVAGAACSLTDTSGLSGGTDRAVSLSPDADAGPGSNDSGALSDGSDAFASRYGKGSIACGASVCQDGFVCCMFRPHLLTCAQQCPPNTITIRCDDATDCPAGDTCCAKGWAAGTPGDVSCAPGLCSGTNDTALCIADQPDACAPSLTCRSDETTTGYVFQSCR